VKTDWGVVEHYRIATEHEKEDHCIPDKYDCSRYMSCKLEEKSNPVSISSKQTKSDRKDPTTHLAVRPSNVSCACDMCGICASITLC